MQVVNKNISKNRQLNNTLQNPVFIDLDEVNKVIELTRFNVSYNFFNFKNIEN